MCTLTWQNVLLWVNYLLKMSKKCNSNCLCSYMSLFVCIKKTPQTISAHPHAKKVLDDSPVFTMCRPHILWNAHAVSTRLWYHLCMKFRALFSSVWGVEQLVVFWLADMVHFTASVCPFPAIWGATLTSQHPPHCWENTAHTHTPPHTEEWDDTVDAVCSPKMCLSPNSRLVCAGLLCNSFVSPHITQ